MAKGSTKSSMRRPTLKAAKALVTKVHKAKAKKNMDTFFFKSKVTSVITPTQGIAPGVSNYLYNQFTLDPTGASAAYIYNAEFNLYKVQYDKFRVNSVKVTFIPKANVLDVATAQNDAFNTTGDGAVHTAIDRDGTAPASISRISRYPSYRKYDVKKQWSRSYSVKYPTGVWVDCQNPAAFRLATELGLSGGITIYAENFLEDNYELWNEPWATVLVEHNIVFQGKTSAGLVGVYDESNNLTGITVTAQQPSNNPPQTVLKNIRGTLGADTRTSDEITEVPITDLEGA